MSRSAKANQIPLPESKQLKKMFYVFYAIHRIVLLRVQNKNGWQGIGLVPFRSVELSSHIYLNIKECEYPFLSLKSVANWRHF